MFCFFHVQASSCPEIRALARQRPLTWRSLAATSQPLASERALRPALAPSQPPPSYLLVPGEGVSAGVLESNFADRAPAPAQGLTSRKQSTNASGMGEKGRDRHTLSCTSWVLPKSLYPTTPLSSSPHASRSGVFGLLSQPPCHPYLERIGRPLPGCRLGASGAPAVPTRGSPRSAKQPKWGRA